MVLAICVKYLMHVVTEIKQTNVYAEHALLLLLPDPYVNQSEVIYQRLINLANKNYTFKEAEVYLSIIGAVLTPFVVLSLFFITYSLYRRTAPSRMNNKYSLRDLAKTMVPHAPQIRPAVVEDILKYKPDSGPWRREASPIRWCIMNNIVYSYELDYRKKHTNNIKLVTFKKRYKLSTRHEVVEDHLERSICTLHNRCWLDVSKLRKILKAQLGQKYTGYENMSDARKAMFVVFAAFAQGVDKDKDVAYRLMTQLNTSWKPFERKKRVNKISIAGCDKLAQGYLQTSVVKDVLSKHAYEATILSELLFRARLKGKMFCSTFIWLKPTDRLIWYALEQEGGETAWIEAASVRAHLEAEREVQGALSTPVIEPAVKAILRYMSDEEGWIPELKTLRDCGVEQLQEELVC